MSFPVQLRRAMSFPIQSRRSRRELIASARDAQELYLARLSANLVRPQMDAKTQKRLDEALAQRTQELGVTDIHAYPWYSPTDLPGGVPMVFPASVDELQEEVA